MSDPVSPFRLVVDASTAGQRADRALADAIGTVSRSRVKALIESSNLSVNGKTVCEPAETLRDGMELLLTFPEPLPARPIAEQIPLNILYE
ncbi:MAG: RNA pseudouridine synthase, partial [Gluconobacter albidus]